MPSGCCGMAGAFGLLREHREVSHEVADGFEAHGSEVFSRTYAMAAPRIPYLVKDPRGWGEFRRMLGEHSAQVLGEWGVEPSKIERLRARAVIGED